MIAVTDWAKLYKYTVPEKLSKWPHGKHIAYKHEWSGNKLGELP